MNMQVVTSLEKAHSLQLKQVALTIGVFDGVHRGHRHLISTLSHEAQGRPRVVITFDPPPAKILSANPPRQLFSLGDQISRFEELGVEYLCVLPFDKTLANMDAAEFARTYIFELFKPAVVVVGYDFVFGRDRRGDVSVLRELASPHSCRVVQVEPLEIDGDIVSSSLIRRLLDEGKVEKAKSFLGRPFEMQGLVVPGKKLGRTLGFPTANLKITGETLPSSGVYLCRVRVAGQAYRALCNVGLNPTVSETRDPKVECYILDFDRDIYGQALDIHFYRRLRDEMKFASLEDLKAQIARDVSQAREIKSLD